MGELKDKVEGKITELKGKVTNDRSEELKGKAQQAWGAVQGKANDLSDALRDPSAGSERDDDAEAERDPTAPA
jgi:uncharacterized protein YjbJ (UPF0337 family)